MGDAGPMPIDHGFLSDLPFAVATGCAAFSGGVTIRSLALECRAEAAFLGAGQGDRHRRIDYPEHKTIAPEQRGGRAMTRKLATAVKLGIARPLGAGKEADAPANANCPRQYELADIIYPALTEAVRAERFARLTAYVASRGLADIVNLPRALPPLAAPDPNYPAVALAPPIAARLAALLSMPSHSRHDGAALPAQCV
jgi:hypothetical protein